MKFLTLTTLAYFAALTAASPLHEPVAAPSTTASDVDIGDVALPLPLNATATLLPLGDKTALKPKQTPRLVVYTANEVSPPIPPLPPLWIL